MQMWVVIALLCLSAFFVHRLNVNGLYGQALGLQVTICSLHAGPIVALRVIGAPPVAVGAWMLCSWACRKFSPEEISVSFLMLEAVFAKIPLTPRVLGTSVLLQFFIVALFWTAIATVCMVDGVSFHPVDRHIRKGLQYVVKTPMAYKTLALEIGGHGMLQALCAAALWDSGWVVDRYAVTMLIRWAVVWFSCVTFAAAGTSPHVLPYNLGTVPVALRWRSGRPSFRVRHDVGTGWTGSGQLLTTVRRVQKNSGKLVHSGWTGSGAVALHCVPDGAAWEGSGDLLSTGWHGSGQLLETGWAGSGSILRTCAEDQGWAGSGELLHSGWAGSGKLVRCVPTVRRNKPRRKKSTEA
jgi:hypothetical protein